MPEQGRFRVASLARKLDVVQQLSLETTEPIKADEGTQVAK